MSEISKHPSDQQLQGFAAGQLDEQDWTNVEQHLTVCEECARRIAQLPANDDDFLGALKKAQANEAKRNKPPKKTRQTEGRNAPGIVIFLAAIEIEGIDELQSYLHEACGDDQQLRANVEALLLAYGRDSMSTQPEHDQLLSTKPMPSNPETMTESASKSDPYATLFEQPPVNPSP